MADCLFCKIIDKKIPSETVFEDDSLIVIKDINPQAPTHLLLIPRKHIERLSDADAQDQTVLGALMFRASELIRELKFQKNSRIVINNGPVAGQAVFHIHVHLLGGRKMTWPPG